MNSQVARRYDDDLMIDEAEDFEVSRPRYSVDGILQSIRNVATLSEALRILGAAVLLASMSVFLLQGWNDGNDIRRYLLLLAQTGLLAAGGFALSHGLKEAKGARIFFGLALVSVPANFTILGALLYSVFQWDAALTTYPGFATWQIEDVANIGITLGGALVVLLPVTLFCFAIMARHSAKALAMNFVVLNALLLLPIRSSLAAGAIALVGVMYALTVVGKLVRSDRALKTGEGKFALMTLFIPAGIILFRSMYFYQVDSFMLAMLGMAVFLAARQASLFPDRKAAVALILELLSVPVALLVALAATDGFAHALPRAFEAPLFAVIYSALAFDILRRTSSRVLAKGVGVTISLFVALSFIFSVTNYTAATTAFMALAAGGLLLLAGLSFRDRTAIVAAIVTAFAGVVFGLEPIFELVVTSSWIDLALFGAAAIALGSVLDRYGVAIKLRLIKWSQELGYKKAQIALDD